MAFRDDAEAHTHDSGGTWGGIAFPDREAMPALAGSAYTTRRSRAEDLSPAAWESAAKARRLSLLERAAR